MPVPSAPRLAALCLALAFAAPRAAEDYSQWSHGGELLLNTTVDGGNVAGNVARFPLLVRLDAGNFNFSKARRDGGDIRFSNPSGKHLPYQIERWDSARAMGEVWVLADTVYGNRDDQVLRMHWGRPSAMDSSRGGAVFDSANGFLGVWHLAEAGGTRLNAVSTGYAAVPMNQASDPSAPGVIGMGDSLDNQAGAEDYFQLYEDYSELAKGFTYSVWAYPTASGNYARLLDLGSGQGIDNIQLNRVGATEDLRFSAYSGTTRLGEVVAAGALKNNQWQHFAVTVSGTDARLYRNGVQVGQGTLSAGLSAARRNLSYIGRSNWAADAYYQGKLDEPAIAKRARSADWIKLSYAGQRPDQKLLSFRAGFACISRFTAPRDTSITEGRLIELSAQAECAAGYSWTAVSALCPRIMDPDVKNLQVYSPRVSKDEVLVYRFTARYGDSVKTKDIRVTVREAIPDPVFAFDPVPVWTGQDSLAVRAVVQNLAQVKASASPDIAWAWTVGGLPVDTAWRTDRLVLRAPGGSGRIDVGLCLDNGGAQVCRSVQVTSQGGALGIRVSPLPERARVRADFRDASGRLRKAAERRPFEGAGAYPAKRLGAAGR